jgi:Glycosyltransferase
MPEVAGKGALLVDPYSVKSIRKAVLEVIQNAELRDTLVRDGLENVKRFTPEAVAEQYAELYRELGEK